MWRRARERRLPKSVLTFYFDTLAFIFGGSSQARPSRRRLAKDTKTAGKRGITTRFCCKNRNIGSSSQAAPTPTIMYRRARAGQKLMVY